jgi:pimeloyl-ACP methyl ester carboxylesterase
MSSRARLVRLLALAYVVLSLMAPSASAQSTRAFGACPHAQVIVPAAGLQCATLDVPFDRADPTVGNIALAVQRVPASAPRTGVIVLLAGGPGQPALPAFEALLAPLAHEPALRSFELVAFDQRGTGQSEGLQCPENGGPIKGGLLPYLSACGTELGATRTFYTSQESVEDLNSLRQALGGTPLSLFAVSYGGRVAGMYAREYPQGVARMVLDSPTPPTGADALNVQRLQALRRVLDEGICGAGACRSFSNDVYTELTRLVAKLHHRPLRTRIYNAHGRLRPASVTEVGLMHLLVGLDLAPAVRELAPAAIAAAANGQAAPLARLTHSLQAEAPGSLLVSPFDGVTPLTLPANRFGDGPFAAAEPPLIDSAISIALFAATYCLENELPWPSGLAPTARAATLRDWLASLPAGATAPFVPATAVVGSAIPLCMDWPATPPAPPSPTGVSATPTLILSGDDDLRTPYEQDLTLEAGYSDVRLLRVPDVGHSTVSTDQTGCARRAMIEFIATGQAPASCPGSQEAQALALPPSSLGEVPAAASSSSRLAGQVATAAAMTIQDLFSQTSTSGGGLRGGSWAQRPHGFVLHGMQDVPGVALSGTIRPGESVAAFTGHLSVRGRLAGELTLRGLTLSGRVGGARVHARLSAL